MAATQPGTAATCSSIPVAAGAWKGRFQKGFELPKNLLPVVSRELPDLPIPSLSARQPSHPLPGCCGCPRGTSGLQEVPKNRGKGKMHFGLHFNSCKSSSYSLSLQETSGGLDDGGHGTLPPSFSYLLSTFSSPSLRPPRLPTAA